MSPKLETLKYIIEKSIDKVEFLKLYVDDTRYVVKDHDQALHLLELAKEIVTEAMLP